MTYALCLLVLAAPAPHLFERKAPQVKPVAVKPGCYDVCWGKSSGEPQFRATLFPGGYYECEDISGHAKWTGTWKQAGNCLHIEERFGNSEYVNSFQFKLIPNHRGALFGPAIRLTPVE